MNGKERVEAAIDRQPTDAVPYYLMRRPEVEEKLQAYLGVDDVDTAIGSSLDLFSTGAHMPLDQSELRPGEVFRDEFGVGYAWTKRGGACPRYHPLEEASLKGFAFPDPRAPERFANVQAHIHASSERFVLAVKYCGLFERAWFLRGMTNLCVDFYVNTGFVNDLLDRLTEFNLGIVQELVKFDVDGIMLGDDWGSQTDLIMGPRIWRSFFKPRLAKLYAEIKAAGLPVFVHSCGNIMSIIPDLIEIGVDVINPIQVIAMDPEEIKRRYGDTLSLFGGVSTQHTFPYGTPEDVKNEVKQRLEVLGDGGGYILAPDQELQMDVPIENIVAFVEAARGQ